jgi:hypothetical protein
VVVDVFFRQQGGQALAAAAEAAHDHVLVGRHGAAGDLGQASDCIIHSLLENFITILSDWR